MTPKDSSCKQIIVLMKSNNINKLIKSLGEHISNLNCFLKSIKSNTIIDIYINHHGLIVTANKVTSPSNLSMVENYIKNTNFIDSNNI